MSKEDYKTRFFVPDINIWKYKNKDNKNESISPIDDKSQETTVKKRFEFFDWTLSFTKNVVQACFILFLIVNLFIAGMITYVYFKSKQVIALEIYISEVYNMFITVIYSIIND